MIDPVATLFKNGMYWLRFRSENGFRMLVPFQSEREAEEWARKKIPAYRVERELHDRK